MRKASIIGFISFIVFLLLSSCGGWRDNIKLSTRSAQFNATGDSIIITTKGGTWWLSGISVDTIKFYKFDGVDIHADSFIIKQYCFKVERLNKYTLFIKVEENPISVKRVVTVGFQAGDYFDRVIITQNPK